MVALMTPYALNEYLCCLRANNAMSAHLKLPGGAEVAVTFGPEWGPVEKADEPSKPTPLPGGWKTEPSDPDDPDPLGLGPLDAPMALDDDEVTP